MKDSVLEGNIGMGRARDYTVPIRKNISIYN